MRRTMIHCRSGRRGDAGERVLLGTLHSPSPGAAGRVRVGILLINAGPAPRAGNSDLYTHLADRLADRGMTCFRFDLPGLGDSTGPSWPDLTTYWRAAQVGGNDEAVRSLVDQLCTRHALTGIILGGLCAGAICSVRSCDAANENITGLLLLEPNFRASAEVERGASPAKAPGAAVDAVDARPQAPRSRLFHLKRDPRLACILSPLRRMRQRWRARCLGRTLPDDVLTPVIFIWKRALQRGVPSLVLLAKDRSSDRYLDRISSTFPPLSAGVLRTVRLPEANHIMTSGAARERAIAAVEEWIVDRFPGVLREGPADHFVTATTPARSTPGAPPSPPPASTPRAAVQSPQSMPQNA